MILTHQILKTFALFLVTIAPALAQIEQLDSLRTVLRQHPQADTFRVNRLNDLAHAWETSETGRDSVATLALELAKRLRYVPGQARALFILGLSNVYRQPKTAQKLLAQALALTERGRNDAPSVDRVLLAHILRLTGISYFNEGERALPYLHRAVTVAKATGQQALIAQTLTDLGTYYAYRSIYPPALRWYLLALRAAEKSGSLEREADALQGIAGVYVDLTDYDGALVYLRRILGKVGPQTKTHQILALADVGKCYLLTGRYPQAIAALQRGLTLSRNYKERPNYHGLPLGAILADAYEQQGNPLAFSYAHRVMGLAQYLRVPYVISRVSVILGRYHLRTGNADSAIYYGRQVIALSQEDQNKIRLRDANQILAKAYARRGAFAQAYAYQTRFIAYKDSINNEEITRKATAVRLNDRMSRQQSQIALLTKDRQLQAAAGQRQRQLLYATLAVLALTGGLLAVLYRNYRNKQRANALLQRQKAEIQKQRDQTQQALTELRTTQVQLVQREKMASLGELTAGIAHEIQNPLNFVNNFAEVSTELIEELADQPQKGGHITGLETDLMTVLKSNLRVILDHGQRASSIVRSMLEHARSTSGDTQPTDLNALCEEFLRLAYQGFRMKEKNFNCGLVTDFDPAAGRLEVIPQEISRVLLNLFNNAFYAVQERQKQREPTYRPTVYVNTLRVGETVEIRVSDNGTGMSEAVRQKIFQPFFTTKPTGQGTGLGLSISYDIITKAHGGQIDVSSQKGQGTEFIIRLPVSARKTELQTQPMD